MISGVIDTKGVKLMSGWAFGGVHFVYPSFVTAHEIGLSGLVGALARQDALTCVVGG